MKILTVVMLIGLLANAKIVRAQDSGVSRVSNDGENGSSRVLPLFKGKIPEEYREHVTLPVGISFNYVHQVLPLEIFDAELEVPGMPLPPGLVRGGTIKPHTDSYVARLDAWLFPFLNVYGTAGYFGGDAKEIHLDLAAPVPLPIPSEASYSGSTYGVGTTGAFAYRAFFASYDINWNWGKPDVTNRLRVTNQGPRVGVLASPGKIRLKAYGGAYRTSIAGHQKGTVTIGSGIPVSFDFQVRPVQAWSPLAGTEIKLTRHFVVGAEGLIGRTKQLVLSTGFRF